MPSLFLDVESANCSGLVGTVFHRASHPAEFGQLETRVQKCRHLAFSYFQFLNVETDDTQIYGQEQYNEDDLLGMKSLSEEENNCDKR